MANLTDFYSPLPKQQDFHNSLAPYRLHVGGFGSGKTLNLVMEAVISCLMVPGSNSLILRTTSPDLQRTVINQFLDPKKIPAYIYKSYNKNEKIVYFHNGSQLHFGYCQRDTDVMQYLSTEYIFIGLEEGAEFSPRVWDYLVGRARASKSVTDIYGNAVKPGLGIATNPIGTGWTGWIRPLFIEKRPLHGMGAYDPNDYFYVHSTVIDNPYVCTPEYLKKLEGLTGSLRKQALEGDMYEVGGQYYSQFNTGQHEGLHVMEPRDIIFKPWDPIWIGSDWDFAHWPVLWFRKGWVKDAVSGNLRCVNVVYRELILREVNALQAAKDIVRASPPNEYRSHKLRPVNEKIKNFYFSWERFMKMKSQGMDHSIAEQLGTEIIKFGIPRPQRADNLRVDGWALIGQLLDMDELVITTDCPNVISTIPVLVHDKDEIGDVQKTESLEDDIADSLRYGLKSFLKPGRIPQVVKDAQALEHIQDPVARQIKAYEQHIKRSQPKEPIHDNRVLPWMVR